MCCAKLLRPTITRVRLVRNESKGNTASIARWTRERSRCRDSSHNPLSSGWKMPQPPHSAPSALRITDMRLAVIAGHGYYPLLRIDTNQGVYGLGEVRDGGHVENALQFKHIAARRKPVQCGFPVPHHQALRQLGAGRRRRLRHRDRAVGFGRQDLWRALLPVPRRQASRPCAHLCGHAGTTPGDTGGLCQRRAQPHGTRASASSSSTCVRTCSKPRPAAPSASPRAMNTRWPRRGARPPPAAAPS